MAGTFVLSTDGAKAARLYKQAKALAELQAGVALDALTFAVAREVEKATGIDFIGKGVGFAVDERGVVHFVGQDGQPFDIMQLAAPSMTNQTGAT